MPRIHDSAIAVLLALTLAAPFAFAKKIYKLTDRVGRVTYVDQVPKGFEGEVVEIQLDAPPVPDANPPAPPPVRSSPASQESPGVRDINSERRAARAKFQERLDLARAKLAAAKKALADGGDVGEDEFQTIQQKSDASGAKPNAVGPRPNCFQQVDSDSGKRIWICPTMSAGEKYHDRQKGLEEAVKKAEEELTAAEDAYRRGTD